MIHAVAGGIYVVVFDPLLLKSLTKELSALGITFAFYGNDIGILCFTLVNGRILGERATPETIGKCCWFLSISAFVGFLLAFMLRYNDKFDEAQKVETDKKHDL